MFYQQIVNGLTIGSTYALVTMGFSMVWSILLLVNFAHSSFYILSAYLTVYFMQIFGVNVQGFLISLLISILITASLTALMERTLLKPLRTRKATDISALLCTVGVQTVINNSIMVIFGSESKSFPDALKLGKIDFTVFGSRVVITRLQILMLVISLVLMSLISLIVYKTKLGTAMRAISQNETASRLVGINVNFVIVITFIIGTVVAAIAGSMVGMYYRSIDTQMAISVGTKSMAAAILGGIGVLPGAVLGGFIIGVVETLFASYVSSGLRDAIAFTILIVFLLFKPTGLFGKKTINKV